MKGLILTLLMIFSAGLFAGDSGIYFNIMSPGEGMTLSRDKGRVTAFIFTYGSNGCEKYEDFDQEESCGYNGTRWFYTSGDEINNSDEEVQGLIFTGHGLNFPMGVPKLDDPFVNEVGEAIAVGYYIMTRWDKGWIINVERIGNYLDEDDLLYSRNSVFTDLLMSATE
jgi:hypothetical protein